MLSLIRDVIDLAENIETQVLENTIVWPIGSDNDIQVLLLWLYRTPLVDQSLSLGSLTQSLSSQQSSITITIWLQNHPEDQLQTTTFVNNYFSYYSYRVCWVKTILNGVQHIIGVTKIEIKRREWTPYGEELLGHGCWSWQCSWYV